jgi:hypothetical protein
MGPKYRKLSQRGQSLVIIALAVVGLFAFTALAIDGGMVFSDRRHAQNAADTAALAAALSKTRGGNWNQDGLERAASNGYNDNGASNEVEIHSPPMDGYYAGENEYVQVRITSRVRTFFARIVGFQQITNRVEAVARAVPGSHVSGQCKYNGRRRRHLCQFRLRERGVLQS